MQKLKLLILLTLLTAATVFGQGTSGRLTGTVSGPDGALPGATVVATDISTGRETTVTANESGTNLKSTSAANTRSTRSLRSAI